MAANLIEIFQHTMGDVLVSHTSNMLGESADHVTPALSAVTTSILAATAQKADVQGGVNTIQMTLLKHNLRGDMLTQAHQLLGNEEEISRLMQTGDDILSYLFDNKLSGIVDHVASSYGLKTSSSMSLFRLVAPFFLSSLGKYISEKSLDSGGIKRLLAGQAEYIQKALPPGMNEFLGFTSSLEKKDAAGLLFPEKKTETEAQPMLSRILPWAILLLTSLALFYFIEKGCSSNSTSDEPVQMEQDITE